MPPRPPRETLLERLARTLAGHHRRPWLRQMRDRYEATRRIVGRQGSMSSTRNDLGLTPIEPANDP